MMSFVLFPVASRTSTYAKPYSQFRCLLLVCRFNSWSVTLLDSMDTMWMMGLEDDFKDAVRVVAGQNFTIGKVCSTLTQLVWHLNRNLPARVCAILRDGHPISRRPSIYICPLQRTYSPYARRRPRPPPSPRLRRQPIWPPCLRREHQHVSFPKSDHLIFLITSSIAAQPLPAGWVTKFSSQKLQRASWSISTLQS